jgi:hypothetical protein
MATTTAKGSGSTVNDGGTIVNAGAVSSDSRITKVIGVNELDTGKEYGSKVLAKSGTSQDYAGVTTANPTSTGGLAYFPKAQEGERNFLFRAGGDSCAKINNTTSTLLTVVGSEHGTRTVNKVHSTVGTRRLGSYSDASFNVLARPSSAMVPGRTKGTGAGNASNFVQMDGTTAATDDAATPTRSVPGELTYHFGGLAQPTTDEYKARNSYEA